jgi:hypothetical protein
MKVNIFRVLHSLHLRHECRFKRFVSQLNVGRRLFLIYILLTILLTAKEAIHHQALVRTVNNYLLYIYQD